MSWIKRNLPFVIGSAVALALLVVAVFYNLAAYQHNEDARKLLDEAYGQFKSLNDKDPNPGDGKTVDNIKIAREQQAELRSALTNMARFFQPIPPIPNWTNPARANEREFTAALAHTLEQLQSEAAADNVTLQPDYNFTFEALRQATHIASGALGPLSTSLGEVAAICHVLFDARVNELVSIRRARVSSEDNTKGPPADYLEESPLKTDLATLAPYEVTFQCFSSELAAVLAGFANSPHGFIVRGINVEPATPVEPDLGAGGPPPPPRRGPPGFGPGGGPGGGPIPPVRGQAATVLVEKPLRVTIMLQLARLSVTK